MALGGYKPLTLDFLAFGAVKKNEFPTDDFLSQGHKVV